MKPTDLERSRPNAILHMADMIGGATSSADSTGANVSFCIASARATARAPRLVDPVPVTSERCADKQPDRAAVFSNPSVCAVV